MGLFSSLLAPVDTYVCLPAIYEIDSTGETDVIVETGVDGLTSIKAPKSVYQITQWSIRCGDCRLPWRLWQLAHWLRHH